MNKNRTTLILTLSLLTMIVSFGALVFFFKVIENKNKHTSAVLTALANRTKQKEDADNLIRKIDEANNIKGRIDSYFVDSKEIDSFINYLESLGTSAGVDLKVKSFDTSSATKNILNVTVLTHGSFSNIMKNLVLIENAPYKIKVVGVRMNQEIPTPVFDAKGVLIKPASTLPEWQTEISFNILLSQL